MPDLRQFPVSDDPLDVLAGAIKDLRHELSDVRSTLLARASDPAARMPAGEFVTLTGAPTLADLNGVGWVAGWRLDAAALEGVYSSIEVPAAWGSVTIDLWWTNCGVGSGDVRWRVGLELTANGGNLATAYINDDQTITAPAQLIAKKSTFHTAGFAVTAGRHLSVFVGRRGSDGVDTLGNDAGFLVAVVRRLA